MYILNEMQTNGNQTDLVPQKTFSDRLEAESAYYTTLAAAAISTIQIHAIVLLDEHGNTIMSGYYEHLPEA